MILETVALIAAALASIPIAILALECLVAALVGLRRRPPEGARPRTVVLVPAHDEEGLIHVALDSTRPQLVDGDRILVVAHNCADGTADVARAAGAEVVEAADDGTGGKPDALKAGLRALNSDPPDVVVIVDADCEARPGSIDALARTAAQHGGPVQGVYLFGADARAGSNSSISSLALLVKNLVRPAGLHALGLPCLLHGAGSAYPFELLRDAPHGEGSIAEDYQLSIDLALEGHPTRFVPAADVRSTLPGDERSAYGQRKRWEHGHLALVFRTVPRLLLGAIGRLDGRLLALALDLSVPPLAFLCLLWAGSFGLAATAKLLGGPGVALAVASAAGVLLFVAIVAGWLRFAGVRTTLLALARVPGYVLWKLPLYLAYWGRRQTRWTKTPRDEDATGVE